MKKTIVILSSVIILILFLGIINRSTAQSDCCTKYDCYMHANNAIKNISIGDTSDNYELIKMQLLELIQMIDQIKDEENIPKSETCIQLEKALLRINNNTASPQDEANYDYARQKGMCGF